MSQLNDIDAIEKKLWNAADTLRANSSYASNEYFMPVMGLIFLRHAYSRFLRVREEIADSLPKRGGKPRSLTKEDFSQKSAIFLSEKAQFEYLVSLRDSEDRAKAIEEAMESIEENYESLRGILPKSEYRDLDNDVLGQLLRTLNPEELRQASGDIFGRIYEYFLTKFADQKAHDSGEFFTPVSLVSLIANVLAPGRGIVLDPASGSGGMFVQGAHFVERLRANPSERLTFFGLEKNSTTIRLAKMNLSVHGLEGNIQQANTYYEDPHVLRGKADFVMANPPFNVDEVDAEKVKGDERLPFGLPGVNKRGRVSNANYLWISYFYSYLNATGRAGFVMSSQASSAGNDEAEVRRKLIETGDVEAMVAIRSNFFYTRSVPCELWFLNRGKPEEYQDKVLMLDARGIYRKVTRRIYDFSPEQLQNILSIFWLYRGQTDRFLELISDYLEKSLEEARSCFAHENEDGQNADLLLEFKAKIEAIRESVQPFFSTLPEDESLLGTFEEIEKAEDIFADNMENFRDKLEAEVRDWEQQDCSNEGLNTATTRRKSLVRQSRELSGRMDRAYKLIGRLIESCEGEHGAKKSDLWPTREIANLHKEASTIREAAAQQLKQLRYFHRQAVWLTDRFPDGELCDVEGLVKLVDTEEIAANDWSLSPGRYVGVAPEEEDEDFDFEEAIHEIHDELEDLNVEAMELAEEIARNFEELEV